MLFWYMIVLLVGITYAAEPPIEDETELLLDLLYTPIMPERYKSNEFLKLWGIRSKLGNFQWKDCGGAAANVSDVKVTPDPLTFPGTLTIGFNININKTIEQPVKANLTVEKKIGGIWLKLPCIDNFGSCVYDNICDLLAGLSCPKAFLDAGINCRCPFKQGEYKLPGASFDIDAAAFPSGDYRLSGYVENDGIKMACLSVELSVAAFD